VHPAAGERPDVSAKRLRAAMAQRKRTVNKARHSVASRSGSALFSPIAWDSLARHLEISGREFSILRGIFDNQVEFAIAKDLGISAHTVHTHVERLHRKLQVTTRTQLVIAIMAKFLLLTESAVDGLPPICPRRIAGSCPLQIAPR